MKFIKEDDKKIRILVDSFIERYNMKNREQLYELGYSLTASINFEIAMRLAELNSKKFKKG